MTPQNPTNKALIPSQYMTIFGLKMMGAKYKQIAETTGYSEDHLRWLFSKNGTLYQYWREWVEDVQQNNVQESLDMMAAHLPDIIRADISVAMRDSVSGSIARERIMQYMLGKPEDRIKLSGVVGVAIGSVADFTKMIHERRKQQSTQGSDRRTNTEPVAE